MSYNTGNLQVNLDVAKRLDIVCRKGDSFELTLEVTDAEGNAIDFSLYSSMKFQVREAEEDTGTPVLEFSYPSDFITSTTGKITIKKTADLMANAEAGLFVYDFQLTDSSNKTVTWFYGLFTINDDISI
jgi:hypothetical protein